MAAISERLPAPVKRDGTFGKVLAHDLDRRHGGRPTGEECQMCNKLDDFNWPDAMIESSSQVSGELGKMTIGNQR
jgi:hypothetical protein